MYYQALVLGNHTGSDFLRTLADTVEDLHIKFTYLGSAESDYLVDYLAEQKIGLKDIPLVLCGEQVIGMGADAGIKVLHHLNDNPHVHWEAGDCTNDEDIY